MTSARVMAQSFPPPYPTSTVQRKHAIKHAATAHHLVVLTGRPTPSCYGPALGAESSVLDGAVGERTYWRRERPWRRWDWVDWACEWAGISSSRAYCTLTPFPGPDPPTWGNMGFLAGAGPCDPIEAAVAYFRTRGEMLLLVLEGCIASQPTAFPLKPPTEGGGP